MKKAKPYTPNFTDKRVQGRLIQAVNFVKQHLREDRPSKVAKTAIDEHIGNQSNPLSKYLRKQLLVCVDPRYNKDLGITKTYRLNAEGLAFIQTQIPQGTDMQLPAVTRFTKELEQGIEYKHTSDRQYHWFQNTPRNEKKLILARANLTHNYDIVCCCPTLLLQHSQQIPEVLDHTTMIRPRGQQARAKWLQGPMDLYLFHVNDYIKNRAAIRQRLAIETGEDLQKIKRALNGLFQGGPISKNARQKTFQLFNYNKQVIEHLQQDSVVKGLTEDIKTIWEYLKPTLYVGRVKTKLGSRDAKITGKQKTALYRQLESRVLKVVDQYLTDTDNEHYLEHDGWTTRHQVNLLELKEVIKSKTGFVVDIDYELLTASTSAH